MDEIRESFVFYKSFYEVVQMFPKEERGDLLEAIIHMGLYDEIPENVPFAMKTAMVQMRASVRGSKSRHDAAVENGRKGGAPKGNSNAKGHGAPKGNQNAKKTNNQNNLNVNVNDNDNDNVNVNVNVNDNSVAVASVLGGPAPPQANNEPEEEDVGMTDEEWDALEDFV